MTDRHEQASAEAELRVRDLEGRNIYGPANSAGYLVGHAEGVEWADANPKPTTITHDDMGAAYAGFMDAEGHPVRRFIVALKAIGIEVEDGDE